MLILPPGLTLLGRGKGFLKKKRRIGTRECAITSTSKATNRQREERKTKKGEKR